MSDPTPAPTPAASILTRGWWTSEHAMSVAALAVNILVGSGVIPTGSAWDKLLLMASSTLTALGYTAARTWLKGQS